MKHIWSVLTTKVIVDRRTNMVSMIDVCDVLKIGDVQAPKHDPKANEVTVLGGMLLNLVTVWLYRAREGNS